MRTALAFLVGLVVASPTIAAVPIAADWRLLDRPQDGDSVSVIDQSSVHDRRDGKQARVGVVYDEQSPMAAIEMTLVIDCARGRERALSFKTYDRSGKIFPQGVSNRFEKTGDERPWHKYLCARPAPNGTLARLGSDFPLVAGRKLLNSPSK